MSIYEYIVNSIQKAMLGTSLQINILTILSFVPSINARALILKRNFPNENS